jgi:hypothetical protein
VDGDGTRDREHGRLRHLPAALTEHRGQVTRRRESLSRLGLTLGDRPTDLGGDLLMDADRAVAVDLAVDRGDR